MRRVSIEPEKNLSFHTTPYQPMAEFAVVVASPAIDGNLRGRGRKNVIWMHLQCIEKCISFLNDTMCSSNSTTKFEYTMVSFTHRVHHEERGDLNAIPNFRLDTSSIKTIKQWQSNGERKDLSVLFQGSDTLKAKADEEVNYHYLIYSCSLQWLDIDQRNSSFGGKFRRRRGYPRYRQDV